MASFGKTQIGTYTDKEFERHQWNCDRAIARAEEKIKGLQEKRKAYRAKIKELEDLPARGKKQKKNKEWRIKYAKRYALEALNAEGKIIGIYQEATSHEWNYNHIWGKINGYELEAATIMPPNCIEYTCAKKLSSGEDIKSKLGFNIRDKREIASYRLTDASAYYLHAIKILRERIAGLRESREKRTYEYIDVYL